MEKQPICEEFKPHAFKKICQNCRNDKNDHQLDDEGDHRIRLAAILDSAPPKTQEGDKMYAWVPEIKPPVTIETYFELFPEKEIPKRGSEGEKIRWKLWRYQVPLQDVSEEHCKFVQPELKDMFEEFRDMVKKEVFDFGIVQEWSKELPIQCATCMMLIEEKEVVVISPKNALSAYHPKCFACFVCRKNLVDLAHCFEVDGNVYCERHYAERHKKRCHTCDELLFCYRYALSCDKFYHKDHLVCYHCDDDLTGSGAFEKNGEMFCSKCYETYFCFDCDKCSNRISIDDKHVSFKNNHWHSMCFQCEICNQSLTSGPFELHDGHYYCCKCYETHYAPRCDCCNKIFDSESKVLKYNGAVFHTSCFKCGSCSKSIGTDSFIPKNRAVYCKGCYLANFGIRCAKCHDPLTEGKGLTYKKIPYHQECFTCHKCEEKIGGKTFTNVGDHCYCMDCYGKHFCKQCQSCDEAILLGAVDDTMYSYDGKNYHERCFVCSVCKSNLADVPITYHTEHLLCNNCTADNADRRSSTSRRRSGSKNGRADSNVDSPPDKEWENGNLNLVEENHHRRTSRRSSNFKDEGLRSNADAAKEAVTDEKNLVEENESQPESVSAKETVNDEKNVVEDNESHPESAVKSAQSVSPAP